MARGVSVALASFIFSLVVAEDEHGPEARRSNLRLTSPTWRAKCRGAANHSRVAEGTRPSPEGVYSGGS